MPKAFGELMVTQNCSTGPPGPAPPSPVPGILATTALTNGEDTAVAAKVPIHRKITREEFGPLAKGGSIGQDRYYVGRGGRAYRYGQFRITKYRRFHRQQRSWQDGMG